MVRAHQSFLGSHFDELDEKFSSAEASKQARSGFPKLEAQKWKKKTVKNVVIIEDNSSIICSKRINNSNNCLKGTISKSTNK